MEVFNNFIFGVGLVPEWETPNKIYIFIEENAVWTDQKEYTGTQRRG